MISLQIPISETQKLLSNTDATTTGVLIVGIVALSAVVVFLFREYKILNSEFK